MLAQSGEQGVDFRIDADVAGQHQPAAEFASKFLYALLDAIALVAESELRAFPLHRLGNAVGNGAAAQQAGDQDLLVVEKAHDSPRVAKGDIIAVRNASPRPGLRPTPCRNAAAET